MNAYCIIIVPFVSLNVYVLECIRECLRLDYAFCRLVLLPDIPVSLPAELSSEQITIMPTGNITIAAKRNMAISRFPDTHYFALIDSDAYPDDKWLKNGIDFLARRPEVWAVGGPNITPPNEPLLQRVVGNAQRSFLVSGPLRFAKSISSSRYCTSLHSCNLILPRQVFERVGGFDETLFSGEDRNLCDRIRAHGKKIFFSPDILVYHHNRSLWSALFFQRLTYGQGAIGISARNLNRFNASLYIPLIWAALFVLCILFAFFVSGGSLLPWGFVTMNILMAIVEAARKSKVPGEFTLTLAAILVCYAGTTIGLLLAVAGIQLDLKRIYTNHPSNKPYISREMA